VKFSERMRENGVSDFADPNASGDFGHPARDGREHAIKLLDALNAPWTLVDAAWTPNELLVSAPKTKAMTKAGSKLKPSDGLEPSTPSLPCAPIRN
jgi:hypothetical protein